MSHYKKEAYKVATKWNTEKEETVEDVLKFPILPIPERNISQATAEHFEIRTAVSEKDGKTPIAHYFPYTLDGVVVGFKKRDLTKPKMQDGHFSAVGFQSVKCDMFGLSAANKTGGKKLFITEGCYDAAVLWEVMKGKYPSANPNVVSISNGTNNAVLNIGQKQNQTFIKKFSECVLVFDADQATQEEREKKKIMKGKDAVAAVYGLMPDIFVADLPEDYDPCDMVREGMEEQLYWAAMKPKSYVPDGFVKYEAIRDKAQELPKLGRPWPWPSFTRLTLGRREGEGYYFGAGVKQGKSELVNKLTEHIITEEGGRIALFKFEEEP